MTERKWQSYEEVANYLLNQFAAHFGVGHFESKQVVPGASGTSWELDAKGCSAGGSTFLVVECKRHTKSGINQAITAALAWEIQDVGAKGGLLISPVGLQTGARKVANASNIVEVVMSENSTTQDYMMRFLNQVCIGYTESAVVSDSFSVTVHDKDGNIIKD